MYVYKRGGYVCAVTVTKKPGVRKKMSVSVQARGNRPVVDEGRYAYLAGPVTVHAGRAAASGSRAGSAPSPSAPAGFCADSPPRAQGFPYVPWCSGELVR
ncbi:hypothetical protein GCM10011428_68980 [Streptomyces violaceus]